MSLWGLFVYPLSSRFGYLSTTLLLYIFVFFFDIMGGSRVLTAHGINRLRSTLVQFVYNYPLADQLYYNIIKYSFLLWQI